MPTKVNWASSHQQKRLLFEDLNYNEAFRNASFKSKGAVYIKVHSDLGQDFMYEIATGMLYPPTMSFVEKVDVEINIKTGKPSIY